MKNETLIELEDNTSISLDILDNGEKVAEMQIYIDRNPNPSDGELFPESWFDAKNKVKPFLEILGITTFGNAKRGYGRAMLQKAYEISKANGCEGRIKVIATWGAGTFYEHCGFVTPVPNQIGKEGTKYFVPTAKKLEILYAKKGDFDLEIKPAKPTDWSDFDIEQFMSNAREA